MLFLSRRFLCSHFLLNAKKRHVVNSKHAEMLMNTSKQRPRSTTHSTLNLGDVDSSALNDASSSPMNGVTDGRKSCSITPTNHFAPLSIRFSPFLKITALIRVQRAQLNIYRTAIFRRRDSFIWVNIFGYLVKRLLSNQRHPWIQGCRKKSKSFFDVIANYIWMLITHFVISVCLEAPKSLPMRFTGNIASPEKASSTLTGPTGYTDLNNSDPNGSLLNTGGLPVVSHSVSRSTIAVWKKNRARQ